MNFQLTEEHLMIQKAARDFANEVLKPGVIERDELQKFPKDEIKKLGELGFMGMMVNPKYGGGGMDTISYVLAMEEISKIDASVSVCMSVNNSLVCWGLKPSVPKNKNKNTLCRWLKEKLSVLSVCQNLKQVPMLHHNIHTAIPKGDKYILNGTKNWITNGNSASVYLVIAQSHPDKGHKGINAFIVEKKWKGVTVGKKENKLGIRGSDTHSIMFTDVEVPMENRIGEDGFGFKFAMKTLSGGRIGIASQALGIASGAYELALHILKKEKHLVNLLASTRLFNLNWPIWQPR